MHALRRRLLAEELLRKRSADDHARYAAAQRRARIDANPHQIDAVMFALGRLSEGGCILADEVGLGKTIEAGLVIAQRLAEGATRVLLIVPRALLGQWQAELFDRFGVQARELGDSAVSSGVYLVGREAAGGARGAVVLGAAPPFDLVVIDEAHEIFAGIHRRYKRDGAHDDGSREALIAHRVRQLIAGTPTLLLTATPIQNSLAELWGLVQYVEPTGTLLGDLATFRDVFCREDDRRLVPGQAHELQRRLATVCRRALRRDAQEFLDKPFVARRGRLVEYDMSAAERALYDDVTEYLLQPSLHAFAGRQRRLLLLGFHRRMASSLAALAASLAVVEARLAALADGRPADPEPVDLDAEDDDVAGPDEPPSAADATHERGALIAELAEVRGFVARARALPVDAKARSFVEVVRDVLARGRDGRGSGKVVVFTESLTTQRFLRDLLLADGLEDDDVTLFSGDNDGPRAQAALERYLSSDASRAGPLPTREAAMRLALVHELATRSSVFISTEAGAKGLNLQFCETVVNYDLPWNPQRIEQRIGRCHRYGQSRDVLVVSFLARGNDAQRLTWDILSRKLELFGDVLGASDEVLVRATTEAPTPVVAALSAELERGLGEVYDGAANQQELVAGLEALRDRVEERRAAFVREQARTAALIEARLSSEVQRVFRGLRDELPATLARFDHDVAALVQAHLSDAGPVRREERDGRVFLSLDDGTMFATGDSRGLAAAQALHLGHPLVQQALAGALAYRGGSVRIASPDPTLHGARGALALSRVAYRGFEPVDRLVVAAIADGAPLDAARTWALLDAPIRDGGGPADADRALLSSIVERAALIDQRAVEEVEQRHLDAAIARLERYADDRAIVARRGLAAVEQRLRAALSQKVSVVGAAERARVDAELQSLDARREALARRLDELMSRTDAETRRWRDHYRKLRFEPPVLERLLEVDFTVEAP